MWRCPNLYAHALHQHYGVPWEAMAWFHEHTEADQEHSGTGERIVRKYAASKEMQNRLWDAVVRSKAAYWVFFEGCHQAYVLKSSGLPAYRVGVDLPSTFPLLPL